MLSIQVQRGDINETMKDDEDSDICSP